MNHESGQLRISHAQVHRPQRLRHRHDGETLWAITSYFNPLRYRNRRRNYRVFREHLPVPLIAVEYSTARFDLEPGDAEILVQLRGDDILWQKERLYNIGRAHLPPACEQVMWIDCDIVLDGVEWPARLKEALSQYAMVQPLRQLGHLDPDVVPPPVRPEQVVDWRTSLIAFLADGGDAAAVFARFGTSHRLRHYHGAAWAARRSVADAFAYYDRMIVGGGDKAFTAALLGWHKPFASTFAFDDAYRQDYLRWASSLHDVVRGSVGLLDTTAYHLWHGALSNRGYDDRQRKLFDEGFRAMEDIAIDPVTGCWRWATHKPSLHEHVRTHFLQRKEDGHREDVPLSTASLAHHR